MSRHLLCAAALAATLLWQPAGAAPLTLAQALDLAVQGSQAAAAARAGLNSATQTARAAGQLPDPILRAGLENLPVAGVDRFSTARDVQTMKRIGLSQEWLSRDKRALRQAAADAAVGREALQLQLADADTRLQTALAYVEAWYADATLPLALQAEQQASEALQAGRARLAASGSGSAEVLAGAAALGQAEDDSADLRQQQAAALLALQRWVGQPADELMAVADWALPTEQGFVAAAPQVQLLASEIRLARQAAALTAAERQPNWTWDVSLGQRTGYPDMVSMGVSIPLRLARAERQDRDSAARQALVEKAEAELAEASRAASAEYRALASDRQGLQQRIQRYDGGVLAPTRQRSAVTLAAYRSNQAALAHVFEARRAELDAQRRLLGLQRELARTQARLAFKPLTTGATP